MAANAHAVLQIPGRCLVTTKPVKTTLNGTDSKPRGRGVGWGGQKNDKLEEKIIKRKALKTDN